MRVKIAQLAINGCSGIDIRRQVLMPWQVKIHMMMTLHIYQVDAFAERRFEGNPAADGIEFMSLSRPSFVRKKGALLELDFPTQATIRNLFLFL